VDEVLRTGLAYCRPDASCAFGGFLTPTPPVLLMLTEANQEKSSGEKVGADKRQYEGIRLALARPTDCENPV
jgi:hypothetical protein